MRNLTKSRRRGTTQSVRGPFDEEERVAVRGDAAGRSRRRELRGRHEESPPRATPNDGQTDRASQPELDLGEKQSERHTFAAGVERQYDA
jgi:hypothetical protein